MFYYRPCGLLGKSGTEGKTEENSGDIFHIASRIANNLLINMIITVLVCTNFNKTRRGSLYTTAYPPGSAMLY